jgi:hypothetical protein
MAGQLGIGGAQLEIVAHGLTAVLATWLGLMVLTRSGRAAGARSFVLLAALLTAWSLAIMVERLTSDASVAAALRSA